MAEGREVKENEAPIQSMDIKLKNKNKLAISGSNSVNMRLGEKASNRNFIGESDSETISSLSSDTFNVYPEGDAENWSHLQNGKFGEAKEEDHGDFDEQAKEEDVSDFHEEG